MGSEAQVIPQSVKDAVKAGHSGRLPYEVDDAISKAENRMAGHQQDLPEAEGLERSGVLEILEQSEKTMDSLMTAMCEKEGIALRALDTLIEELTQQGDPDQEVGILRTLREQLQEQETQQRREAVGSVETAQLATHFKRCLTLQFARLMQGDSAPSRFSDLERVLCDTEEALVLAWAMEPTQYADVKKSKGSFAFALARVDDGNGGTGKTPETLEVYREVAREFVVGIFKRWIDGKPVTVERRLKDSSRADKPKATDKTQMTEDFQRSPKRELLLAGVAEMVTVIVDRMPITPEGFTAEWQRRPAGGKPVADSAMEAVSGFFFDGFGRGLTNEDGKQETSNFAKQPEDVSAWYRGALLRSMIEGGGDQILYVDALAHLTPTDTVAVAKAALRVMDEMPTGSEAARDKIAVFILMLPQGTLSTEESEKARIYGESQFEAEKARMVETSADLAAHQIAETVAKATSLYQKDMQELVTEMSRADYDAWRDRAFIQVVRRMALADVVQVVVRDSFALLASSGHPPTDIVLQSKAVNELKLPFRNREPATPPTLADAIYFKLAFATELFDPQVMTGREANITQKISERFDDAPKYGITRAELVAIHNRVAATAAELNTHLQSRRGTEWTRTNNIQFTDVLGTLSPEKTGAYYSARTLVNAPGINRVNDPQTYSKTEGTVAMYLTDREARPPENYVEAFKPTPTLSTDVDVLDEARDQLQIRESESRFLDLVQSNALYSALDSKAHYQLKIARPEATVPFGYDLLMAKAQDVTPAVDRVLSEMPKLPAALNPDEDNELKNYFDPDRFPETGLGAGAKRSLAKSAARSFVRTKWGVDTGDFDDKTRYQVNDAYYDAKRLINSALEQTQQEAWKTYQRKFDTYRQFLEQAFKGIDVTAESFAQAAIDKYKIADVRTNTLSGFWFQELAESGKDGKKLEVGIESLGAKETSDLNTIAKIARESSEAYAAFLQTIIQALNGASDRAKEAGGHLGQRDFKENVLIPAWQVLRPDEYSFTPPRNILDTFTQAMQPALEARANAIVARREGVTNPADKLAQTSSVVTRVVGTML